MEEKNMFIDLLRSTKRKGIEDLIFYLEKSDFFKAPASSKFHLAVEGGLLKHSLNVYYNLSKMNAYRYPEPIVILVSLLHDICKVNYYKKVIKNIKNEKGIWEQTEVYQVDEGLPLGHGEKSVMLIQRFIDLTEEEMLAIRWHMGGFESKDNYSYLRKTFSKSELAVLLHMADLKATYIDETEESWKE